MKPVLETITGGASYLEKKGIEEGRRNMEHLLAHVLGCDRLQLYTQFDRPLVEEELELLRQMLRKRGEGMPLQHILGEVWFHGRSFLCDPRGLIPRPETEELTELVLSRIPEGAMKVLDMGCGSGVIGLTICAERPESNVTLCDISPDALGLARENATRLDLEGVSLVESDLFREVVGEFDVIVANLPYVAEGEAGCLGKEVGHDPGLALFSGPEGMDLLERFIPEAYGRLAGGGLLALEIGHDQSDEVMHLLEAAGFRDAVVEKDLFGVPRFPFARV